MENHEETYKLFKKYDKCFDPTLRLMMKTTRRNDEPKRSMHTGLIDTQGIPYKRL